MPKKDADTVSLSPETALILPLSVPNSSTVKNSQLLHDLLSQLPGTNLPGERSLHRRLQPLSPHQPLSLRSLFLQRRFRSQRLSLPSLRFQTGENNHNLVRTILPNGRKLASLTQENLNLLFSHINAVPRKVLVGKTPYEVFRFFYGTTILTKLGIQPIPPDAVTLQPFLLKIE